MELPEDTVKDLSRRLKRVEGQVRAVEGYALEDVQKMFTKLA